MDNGIISKRYAKALYAYATEHKEETILYKEMKTLSESFSRFKALQKVMDDPTIASKEKLKLLKTAIGESVSKSYESILRLIAENHRESYIQMIALVYQEIYRKEKGLITAQLTTAVKPDKETENKLKNLVSKGNNQEVDFIVEVNPEILGGFILEVDFNRLDASIKNQLNKIKVQLIKN